jgi:hypothetical protein
MLNHFKYADWSFSGTAEWVVGALLVLTIVATSLV